ncbi:MAG: hypothetical protein JHD16_09930 [Solirubrobacteraceae bacterium]|nr:hypothetical protein [Solirubrobacteraceae bacterium]
MTRIADLSIGESNFDARFLKIMEDSKLEREEFEGLDYFTWVPFFVIAGATVAPKIRVHGDHTHFEGATVDVPEDQLIFFFEALPHLLAQVHAAHEEE